MFDLFMQARSLRSTNRVLAPEGLGAAAASTAGGETAGGASEEFHVTSTTHGALILLPCRPGVERRF